MSNQRFFLRGLLALFLFLIWTPVDGRLQGATLPAGTNAAARCHLRLQYPVEGAQFQIALSPRTICLTQPVMIHAGLEGRAFQAGQFCFEWRRENATGAWHEIGKDEGWNRTFISWTPTTLGKYHVRAWARTLSGWIVSQTETLEVVLPKVNLMGVPKKAVVGNTISLSVLMAPVEVTAKSYRFEARRGGGPWEMIQQGDSASVVWTPAVAGTYDVRVVGQLEATAIRIYSSSHRLEIKNKTIATAYFSETLRWLVPGQVSWENAWLAWVNGQYWDSAGWGALMISEQMLWLASASTLGGAKPLVRPLPVPVVGMTAAKTGQNLLPSFMRGTIDDVVTSAARLRNSQITEGTRAIEKKLGHAKSGNYTSAFQGIAPTQANAESLIRSIMSNPTVTVYGHTWIDIYNSAGQGVRIGAKNAHFEGFIELQLRTR